MATRGTKTQTNSEIAIELTKAALLGGALQQMKPAESIGVRIRQDAYYAARLYTDILARLNTMNTGK